ncbi:MAG: hypothetical protein AAF703_00765 [Cyanobacteria bacterium P01_D01_bin.105]
MDRIQLQASKLWDLLFDDETAETYQKTLNLTGTILKEFAQLIWLTLISVFVFGAWFSDTSVKAGKRIRDWLDSQGSGTSTDDAKPIGETSKELLDKGLVSVNQLLNQARAQLGLAPQEITVKPANPPAANPPAAKPAPAAQKPPVSTQSVASKAEKPSVVSDVSSDTSKSAVTDSVLETSREEEDNDWPPQEAD